MVWLLSVYLLLGCSEDSAVETFATEITVEVPDDPQIDSVEISKRIRFSTDPQDAQRVTIQSAHMTLVSPEGGDFAFLRDLEVYVRRDEDRFLLARLPEYTAGASRVELVVEFLEDMREFAPNERISLVFVAYPSRWYRDWPSEPFTVRAEVSLEFELF